MPPKTVGPQSASLYDLESVWKDQNGHDFRWSDSKGRLVLVAMVYTSCEHTCPLIVSELKGIVDRLPTELQPKVQVLIFSFDPERDTLQRLSHYADERGLNKTWRLMRGSADDVQELATVLGVRYKKLASGDYAHSNTVTILDEKGRILHQQLELFRGRDETVGIIKKFLPVSRP